MSKPFPFYPKPIQMAAVAIQLDHLSHFDDLEYPHLRYSLSRLTRTGLDDLHKLLREMNHTLNKLAAMRTRVEGAIAE